MLICEKCWYKSELHYPYYIVVWNRISEKQFLDSYVKWYDILPEYLEQFIDSKDSDILVRRSWLWHECEIK